VYKTRAPACSPSFSPRFHHDNWDSGNYAIDAVDPGRPYDSIVRDRVLSFAAPGADLLCGTATRYEVVTSKRPITPAGTHQSYSLPAGAERYIAIRALNAAGNIGLPAVMRVA
jgi:hypothetical protein